MKTTDFPLLAAFEHAIQSNPDGKYKGAVINFDGRRGSPDQRIQFAELREAIISALLDNLRSRFPRVDIIDAMQVNRCTLYNFLTKEKHSYNMTIVSRTATNYGKTL